MVQAQAQAQRQEPITAAGSLELVKALLRVSIYHVSYLRGIFPEEHYKPVEMKNLDNMEIRMLLAKNEESNRLVQWVEGGVTDALERRYLHKLFFGFSRDKEGRDLLEEYVFSFSHDADGAVHMTADGATSRSRFSTKDAQGPTLNAVKYQVCRLMRMLVEITNTLEQVPKERYLFMKLTYTDDTPEEYEPPMFAPAADGGVGCFSRMPFVMEVGSVNTNHLKVGLAVKTILDHVGDTFEEGDCVPVADDNSHLDIFDGQCTTGGGSAMSGGGSAAAAGGAREACERGGAAAAPRPSGGGFSVAGAQGRGRGSGRGEVHQSLSPDTSAADAPLSEREQGELRSLRAWLLGRASSEVHIVDGMARFASIAAPALDAYFAVLVKEGLLAQTAQEDCFQVVKPAAAAAPAAAARKQQAAAEDAAMAAFERMQVQAAGSQEGGMHAACGSELTESRMAPAGGKRKAVREDSEAPNHFPESQLGGASAAGGQRARKVSRCRDPISPAKRVRRSAPPKEAAAAAPAAAAPVPRPRRTTRR